jgi:hypothetical protein
VGYEYGFPRSTDVVVDDLEYHLVYGIARIHFIGPAYVVGRVGYTSLSVTLIDLSGSDEGVSWGAGLGVKLGRFKIEALYNEFDVTVGSTDATIDYTNTSLRAIFSF